LPTVLYGAKTMNMISTGAFKAEMDGSVTQKNLLVNKLVSAWEQKNSKTARAGGVSLMALSLAACGGSSDETSSAVSYSLAEYDAAKLAATAAAEAAAAATAATVAANAATAQATAVSLALRNAAEEGTPGSTFAGMTDAAMIAVIKASDNSGIADAAVAALACLVFLL
jgi:hypothetical protein